MRHDLAPDALQAATVDDMVFLGVVAMEVMHEVLDARDRILAIAARGTR